MITPKGKEFFRSNGLESELQAFHRGKPAGNSKRIESIDLLRGLVMIIMVLDHVRDYFHYDAFFYNPEDLSRTSVPLFFTRWITHYCAPVFVFLAGVSANLYGVKKGKKALSYFLLTRGIWLVFVELFILSLFRTFNLTFSYLTLQVIWAIGVSMIVMSALIFLNRKIILLIGLTIITTHNLLDSVHVSGNGLGAFLWSFVHEVGRFNFGGVRIYIHYPVLPWIGIMAVGFFIGDFYARGFPPGKRKRLLFSVGVAAIVLFVGLRLFNLYGDPEKWTVQNSPVYSLLSFLNVTKYPPSLLYTLVTLGPALIFLSVAEGRLTQWTAKITLFGKVPMFFYLGHILLIHILAVIAAIITGFPQMIVLDNSVNAIQGLKGYGFSLYFVYMVWVAVVMAMYPLCKWFGRYKSNHHIEYKWLSYI